MAALRAHARGACARVVPAGARGGAVVGSALSQSPPQETRKTLARGSEARARRRRSVPRFAVPSGPRNGLLQREARPGVEECQTRWRTLRDTYLKRKKRRRAGANGQWSVLERDLGFLDDFLRPRTRRSTLNAAAPADVEVKQEQPGEDAETREAAVAAAAAPPQPWPLAMRPAAVMPDRLAAGGAAAQELSSDPEEFFCLSLAAHLKRLVPRERSIARMKMLETLHNLEFGDNIGEAALGEP
ncbi:hypothetical protein V5799_012072 [Amblyomma americanum]|uniref:BESS domain-containing protein n=1 Tax=Amblyomma americanum TaxID=6943 RepID=A0AAQ4EFA0_AMBAM